MKMTIPTLTPQVGDDSNMLLARLAMGQSDHNGGQLIALASAARTATTQSADIATGEYSGIIVCVSCSIASGTGGLTVRIRYKDSVLAVYPSLSNSALLITAVGVYVYQHGPGTGTTVSALLGSHGSAAGFLTDTTRIEIIHGDASSYTYQVTYTLVR